ncbi:carboxymuconolactone decarboxylase family protein [Halomonas sp. HMF6819]|uniref:carboxymuconolactone decarboxylase family protein n=1 Tax=Halomonas sp. HMF6819 TaxID=3373085 RepID=UPI00378D0755
MTSYNDNKAPADIKAMFIQRRGYWRPWTQTLLEEHPAFLEAYARYASYPASAGPLDARMVELIYVALDASATHLFEAGVQTHLELARQAGATTGDVLDVLHLVALQGVNRVYEAIAILESELGQGASFERGATSRDAELPEALRREVERHFPGSAEELGALARFDAEYLRQVMAFMDVSAPGSRLVEKEKRLVEAALHSSFTGFDEKALRRSIRAAVRADATADEIAQAIQLGSHLSVHGTALGVKCLGADKNNRTHAT